MNDNIADTYVSSWGPVLRDLSTNPEQFTRTLRQLVKEVERDTRHRAFDKVQALANDVSNNLWNDEK